MEKQPKRRKFYDNPYTLLTENNTYYEFEEVFRSIVAGFDCIGLVMGATPDSLYYWYEKDGKTCVDDIDYDYLTELANKALKCYEKTKEDDLEIC